MTLASGVSGMSQWRAREPLCVLLVAYSYYRDASSRVLGIGQQQTCPLTPGKLLASSGALCAPVTLSPHRHPRTLRTGSWCRAAYVVAVSVSGSVSQLQISPARAQRLDRRFLVDTYDDGIGRAAPCRADQHRQPCCELRIVALAPALATRRDRSSGLRMEPRRTARRRSPRAFASIGPFQGQSCGWWPIESPPVMLLSVLRVDRRRAGSVAVLQPVEPSRASVPRHKA